MGKGWKLNSTEFFIINHLGEYDKSSLKNSIKIDAEESASYFHISFDKAIKDVNYYSNAALTSAARKLVSEGFLIENDNDFSLTNKGVAEWDYLRKAYQNDISYPGWTTKLN